MLVIGPSLPVLRYLWSFSRSRQPLLRHWQFRSQKFATTPLPLSTWRYGAVHICLCTGRWDIWVPPQPPEYASIHLGSAPPRHGRMRSLIDVCYQLGTNSYMMKPVDFGA
jgi:hypothetical protein